MLKNQDAIKIQQTWDGRNFLETLDCARILNHKNYVIVFLLEKKCQKSKEHYIKRKFCLRNIFSNIKIDIVILDQKCWNSQKWAICVQNSQKSLYSWENIGVSFKKFVFNLLPFFFTFSNFRYRSFFAKSLPPLCNKKVRVQFAVFPCRTWPNPCLMLPCKKFLFNITKRFWNIFILSKPYPTPSGKTEGILFISDTYQTEPFSYSFLLVVFIFAF